MTQTNKTRLAKRKLEITGVRKEKQTMTSKKNSIRVILRDDYSAPPSS